MEALHLDTHVLAWLWSARPERVRTLARRLARRAPIASPMAVLELQFLFEIGRVREPADLVIAGLSDRIGLGIAAHPFAPTAWLATRLAWTRDPFDRLIVASAMSENARLLTADENIQRHYPRALAY